MPTPIEGQESVYETGRFRVVVNKFTGGAVVSDKETGKIVSANTEVKTKSKIVLNLTVMVVMTIIGVASFIFISTGRPAADLPLVGGLVLGFVATATLQILNLIKQDEVKTEAAEAKQEAAKASAQTMITHSLVNSNTSQTFAEAVNAAEERGRKSGKLEAENRADALTRQRTAVPPDILAE